MGTVLNYLFIITGAAIVAFIAFSFWPDKRPFPTESDWANHRTPWWQLYYSSKYINPVRRACCKEVGDLFSADMASTKPSGSKEMSLSAVGDLMCRRDLIGEGGKTLWEETGEFVFSSDLSIGNMEFVVNPSNVIEKLLRFSVTPAHAEPLLGNSRFGQFSAVSLGNNHINDSGSKGIVSTCNYLDSLGIKRAGAAVSADARDNLTILEHDGLKIALLSYTFSTNGLPLEKDFLFGTNVVRFNALKDSDYDPSLIHHHIGIAKAAGADLIVASCHWGIEFEYYPPLRLIERAHGLIDQGVDLIIGHHPHIINPVERYRAPDGREGVILYSLGNLTAWGLKLPIQKMSIIVKIAIHYGSAADSSTGAQIGTVSIMPVYHSRNEKNGVTHHRLIPVLKTAQKIRSGATPSYMNKKDKDDILKLEKEFNSHFYQNGIIYL